MVPTWLKSLFPRRSSRTKTTPRTRPAARPSLVQLEDRAVPAVISIANNAIVEGNAGTQTLMFTVSADAAEAADITFKINTADVTAKAGSDYVALSNAVGTITAGNKSTTVMVTINGDTTVELTETFTVTLSDLSAGNTFSGGGATESATGTITNDDNATITIANSSTSEGNDVLFTATISKLVDTDVTIKLTPSTQGGNTAIAGTDYSTATQVITILAGNTTGTALVASIEDTTVEGSETFTATLSDLNAGGRSVTGNGNTATGTITNDDSATVTIANSSASEGNNVVFTATLSNPVDINVTIDLTPSTQGGNTATAATDYDTAAQSITILAGQLTGTAEVTTDQETIVEADETFTATLSNLSAVGRPTVTGNGMTATGTILNDDTTILTINSLTFSENSSPQTFTINSSNAVQGGFSVQYKSADGTATAGVGKDYTAATGTETFAGTANENETFDIIILGDSVVEADETFILSLFNVTNGNGIAASAFNISDTGTGTMTSADTAQFRITANASATEGGPITFTITLTNPVEATTSVTITTTGGSATNGTDYTDATGMVVTFVPFDQSETFMVATTGDNIVEANETFNFSIGGLNDGGLTGDVTIDGAQDSRTGTINNDDSAQFRIQQIASANEGSPVMFEITLTNPVDVATSVEVTTIEGVAPFRARSPQDFTGFANKVISFPANSTSQTVMVVTIDDAAVEVNEKFTILLNDAVTGGRSVTIDAANDLGTGTIIDNDGASFMIDDVTRNEADGTMTFTVTLVGTVDDPFTVSFKALNGTATLGDNDFTLANGTLTFDGTDGQTKTITVTLNDDNKVEADETFMIELFNPTATVNVGDKGLGTIVNDDSAQFKIAPTASATEGSPVSFTVTLTNPVDVATSVTVTTADITAVAGTDYSMLNGVVVNFAANDTSETVPVPTSADNVVENDETFTIALGGLNNGGRPTVTIDAANSTGTGTITNDDNAVFSIANASATEGNTITFTITLSNPVSTDTSVTVTTSDLTAADGTDYTGLVGVTVLFPAGTTNKTVTVNTASDAVVEADETFKATLGGLNDGGFPGNVTISGINGSATGTITNDDSAALTIVDVTQAEAAGTMKFTVTLGADVQGGFSVDFKTIDGTATIGDADYVSTTGTLNFAGNAGETQSFTVTINDDNKVELDQTFTVSLFNVVPAAGVSAASIDATDTATGTIVNDDAAQFSINAASAVIEGGMVTFTVTLTNPVDAPTSVTVTTTDGTAKSVGAPAFDNDFTAKVASVVSFGATVTSVNVSVPTTADNIVELDELFSIALGGLNDAGRAVTIDAANDTGTGTITNDDSAQVKISKVASAIEGGPITFTVTLTNPIDVATTVEVTTADLTANAGVDYTAVMGKLVSFAALDTSEDVTVLTTADLVVEANETFTATLGNLTDGGRPTLTISGTDNVGTGTITNDDKATLITIANVTQNEDTGDLVFTVQLTADVQGGFNVDIMSKDGTATVAGSDYTFSKTTLAFVGTAGETKMFSVPATADNMVEADETFTVHLSNLVPNDAKVSPGDIDISSVGTGTLTNDDSTTLTVADVSQAEGAGTMTFTVTLSNPVQGGLKVDFKTFDGTALIADNDYNTSMGTLTFAGTAGETQTFTVTVNDDSTIEPDEFFTTKLSNVVTLGAGVSAAKVDATDTAVGNILTDDTAVIDLFASTDVEGNNLVYTITLSNKISKDVSVDFATLAGVGGRPAVSGVDFTAVAKTVTFTAGTTKMTVLVPLTDDRRVEGSEQFEAKISNIQADPSVISAFSFGKAQDTATITDNDTAVFAFTAANGGAIENNVAGVTATVQLTVNATGAGADGIDRPITVRIANAGGTATNGVDYLNFTDPTDLTFAPGNFTTTSQNIAFDLVEDLNKEGDETIVFNLAVLNDTTGGKAAIGATPVHTFAIQSDDEAVRTYDATAAGDYRFVNDGKGNVQLFLGATLLSTDAIGTQAILLNGTANTAQPVEGVESATVDYVNGSPVPTGGITFNANGPAAGERFLVSGGNFASIQTTLSATQSGTLVLTGTTTDTLTYQNVDAVEINAGSVGSLTLQLPAAASQAILEDDGIAGNGISQIRSGNGTFATTKFVNPTGTLTVAPGANLNDTLTIAALPDNTSSLVAGFPAVRFTSITQNGAVGSIGNVSYFADTIGILANLTATGSVLLNATGSVTLGTATISGNTVTQTGGSSVTINAGSLATVVGASTINFDGAIDGPGSLETKGAATSTFQQPIGAGTALAGATFGSKIDATGTGSLAVTGGTVGGKLNVRANTIAINAEVNASNGPVVLRLVNNGAATQTAPFTATKLYLEGNGTFTLNNAKNQLIGTTATIASFLQTEDAKIQALEGELFASLTGGSIDVRDSSDLFIRYEGASLAPAIQIGSNGKATLTSGSNVSIEDPRTKSLQPADAKAIAATPLIDVGSGTVQVNIGVDRRDPTQSTIVRFLAEAKASTVTIGIAQPDLAQTLPQRGNAITPLENVAKDQFIVRPAMGAQLVLNGNSPVINDDPAFRPFDTLVPRFDVAGGTSLVPAPNSSGTFSFSNSSGFKSVVFTSIESIGGLQSEAFVVLTGPSLATTANKFDVRFSFTLNGQPLNGPTVTGSGLITNPFVVSPTLGGSMQFRAPQISFGDVDGDGVADFIIANGSGDAPLITVVKGSRFTSGAGTVNISNLTSADLITQFFAFEESFRGGVQAHAADFNGDGKAEIAVAAGNGGGPRITVFQIDSTKASVFNNARIFGAIYDEATNAIIGGAPYNFFPYESSFRGGVNVAVGDVNGDGVPDIIAGAGVGGGPRVRIYDGKVSPSATDNGAPGPNIISDFFAYDPGFRGGVFVDAGRFDLDLLADVVTAPGPGGSAHIQLFQGRDTTGLANKDPFDVDPARGSAFRKPVASFDAFVSLPDLFNPQASRTGVGGVAFGSTTDSLGSSRGILVTRPVGSTFEIINFVPQFTGLPLTQEELDAGASLVPVGEINGAPLILKRLPNYQEQISGDLPFDQLRGGGSAAGSS